MSNNDMRATKEMAYTVGAMPDTAKARVLSREEVLDAVTEFNLHVEGGFVLPALSAQSRGLADVVDGAVQPSNLIKLETRPLRPATVVKIGERAPTLGK